MTPNARLIDGILLTKFDTIDDKVSAHVDFISLGQRSLLGDDFSHLDWVGAGWGRSLHGLHLRLAGHVRRLRAVIRGSQEAQRQVHRQDPPQVVLSSSADLALCCECAPRTLQTL